ncbi:MAG: VWA domain-containing protein [bacterium]|nr:VWA domain-containing protein [bacterium]
MGAQTSHAWNGFGKLVAAFLIAASPLMAQVADRGQMNVFFDPVEVSLVDVDACVTDANGQPVLGLTLADFEVLEDGQPVAISHFSAASGLTALSTTSDAATQTDLEQVLVVFFDGNRIAPRMLRRTIDSLRELLTRELPAKLRLMLITHDDGVKVRTPLTDDPSHLVSVLDEIVQDFRPRPDSEHSRILRDLQNTAASIGSTGASQSLAMTLTRDGRVGDPRSSQKTPSQRRLEGLVQEVRAYVPTIRAHAATQRQRTERLLGELEILVRSLSVIPGQKAVLMVGGGLEVRPGEGLFFAWEQMFPEISRLTHLSPVDEAKKNDVGPIIRHLAGSANRHRISFHTLSDPTRISSGFSAEGAGANGGLDLDQTMTDRDVLFSLSRATGGRSLVASSELPENLGRDILETNSCYSLGYSPENPRDGQYHALTVRVGREGLRVRHREGFLDTGSGDQIVNRVLAAAVLGVTDNQLMVSTEAQEIAPPQPDGGYLVPVLVKVPIAQLVLQPDGLQHTGQITALVMARGPDGLSDLQSWRYPITVPNNQITSGLSQQAGLMLQLVMGEGQQRIAIGVRDDVAGTEATAILEIILPPQTFKDTEDGDA